MLSATDAALKYTKSSVRRERMGHIELAAPVSHIWYFKGIPSRMGLILDLSPRTLEKVFTLQTILLLDRLTPDFSTNRFSLRKNIRMPVKHTDTISVLEWVQNLLWNFSKRSIIEKMLRNSRQNGRCNWTETCQNHQETGSCRIFP